MCRFGYPVSKDDIIDVMVLNFGQIGNGKGEVDAVFDHLGNRRCKIRSALAKWNNRQEISVPRAGLGRLRQGLCVERAVKERLFCLATGYPCPRYDQPRTKPISAAVSSKEFFGSSQQTQFMTRTTWLPEALIITCSISALAQHWTVNVPSAFEVLRG